MIKEEMGVLLGKLATLIFSLNAMIDAGKHQNVSYGEVYSAVENKSIFEYLAQFEDLQWALARLTEEEKWHLTGEWQSMANAIDAQSQLLVSKNGICLLLAYVAEGIQMRTNANEVWPGPNPW